MKGTIFTAVLMQRHLSRLQPPAVPRKPWPQHRSPSPSPAEEPADETSEEAYHKITAEEAKQMMDEGQCHGSGYCARRKDMRPDIFPAPFWYRWSPW